jgi:hypothetical protein
MSLVALPPLIQVRGRSTVHRCSQPRDRLGNIPDDLVSGDDAHMQVRHQGQCAPALTFGVVKHDRAGYRDPDHRGGEDRVDRVELVGPQRRLVLDDVKVGGQPRGVEPWWDNDVAGPDEALGDGSRDALLVGTDHGGLVVLDALHELSQQVRQLPGV